MRAKLPAVLPLRLHAALSAGAQEPADKPSPRLILQGGATPGFFAAGDKGSALVWMSVNGLRRLNNARPAQGEGRFRALDLGREADESVGAVGLGECEVAVGEERRATALERYGFEPVVRDCREREGVSMSDAAKGLWGKAKVLPRTAEDALVDGFMSRTPNYPRASARG
jgi:hypothetical protein